jgi:hypothetical protein
MARVYDEGAVGHGNLRARSSVYTKPIKAMTAAEKGDLMTGDYNTACGENTSTKAAAKPTLGHGYTGKAQSPIEKVVTGAGDTCSTVISGLAGGGRNLAYSFVDYYAEVEYGLFYWGPYELARAMNQVGGKFGPAGSVVSHIVALPLVAPEAFGLGQDIALDWVKANVYGNGEKLNDEGRVGSIVLSQIRDLPVLKDIFDAIGTSTYLPGWREDGGIDFEW